MGSDISLEARHVVHAALAQIERDAGVTVLFAGEAGSRAWGFASTDSDWDVRYVYRHPRERYLSIDPPEPQLEITIPSAFGDLDVVGWDVVKALRLLRKSNPPLMEWLHSPIVYRSDHVFTVGMRALAVTAFAPRSAAHHYAGMAWKAIGRAPVGDSDLNLKKCFYALRASLAFQWIALDKGRPPVRFHDLVDALVPPESSLRAEMLDLLEAKAAGVESDALPPPPSVLSFLEDNVARFPDLLERLPQRSAEELDSFSVAANDLLRRTLDR